MKCISLFQHPMILIAVFTAFGLIYAAGIGVALGTIAVVAALFGCCAIPLMLSFFCQRSAVRKK